MKRLNSWQRVLVAVCLSFVIVSCSNVAKTSRYTELYKKNVTTVDSSGLGEYAQNQTAEKLMDMTQFKTVELDLPYAYAGKTNPAQRLDIIYPSVGEAPYKVIMVFHGGGWTFGSKQSETISAIQLASTQGYAMVNVNYRLSGEAIWPAPLYDAKAAVRFIRANAEKYKLDASNIVVWGNSTGGHLAEMLGATNGRPEYEDLSMGSAKASSDVQGVVSWYGVADMSDFPKVKEPANQEMGFNTQIPEYKEKAEKASPLYLVTKNFPPILLVHGTNDQVAPYHQSVKLLAEINRVCGEGHATLKTFDGAGHGDAVMKTWQNVMDNLNFVDKVAWPDGVNPNRNDNKTEIKILK
jgi:acetyl esterase/lipase